MAQATTPTHPILACAATIQTAVTDAAAHDPMYLSVTDKQQALVQLTAAVDQVQALRLRVLAAADSLGDVADAAHTRDTASWLAHHTRTDPATTRRHARQARLLTDQPTLHAAVTAGTVHLDQAEVIGRALTDLDRAVPDLDPDLRRQAMDHLIGAAAHHPPRVLRILGRKILTVIDPDTADDYERRRLEEDDARADRATYLTTRRNGDGTTDLRARLSDTLADRLLRYLHAFTNPRRDHHTPTTDTPGDTTGDTTSDTTGETTADTTGDTTADTTGATGTVGETTDDSTGGAVADGVGEESPDGCSSFTPPGPPADTGGAPEDRRSYQEQLGAAFGSFLEAVDPMRLPIHGGDATTVVVTIDLQTLRGQLGAAGMIGEDLVSAAQARRLACNAKLIPAVLGGDSEVLDLGRSQRLYGPAARRAKAIRHPVCQAKGCTVPAAWCEAHHRVAWANGGSTDLEDLVLLCSFHHHHAHTPGIQTRYRDDGVVTFHRRPHPTRPARIPRPPRTPGPGGSGGSAAPRL